MNKVLLVTLGLFIYMNSWACSPLLEEEIVIIPPRSINGEFQYIYPKTEDEKLVEEFKGSDIALVNLYIDYHRSKYPHDAHTEIEVAYGWGQPKKRLIKYIRPETSCGKPEKHQEDRWYFAVFNSSTDDLPYKYVRFDKGSELIESRGEPDYVHTTMGLHRKP